VKAIGLLAAGFGALRLLDPDRAAWAQDWLEELSLGHHLGAVLAGHALTLLNFGESPHFGRLAVGAFVFAALFVVEGVGLALARRWAEYLTVFVGLSFVPVEILALFRSVTLPRSGALVLNIAVVWYLIVQLRAGRNVQVSR
jgi:uncharacterized membrane protein (DUF2068 family)